MEVEAGVRRALIDDPTVNGYIAGKCYKHRLEVPVDATGGRCVVVRRVGQWASPDPVKTSEFPTVEVDVWADHSRDADGEITTLDGADGAFAVFRAVDRVLHARRGVEFGNLFVVTSARWAEPWLVAQDEFEASCVRGRFALQVIH